MTVGSFVKELHIQDVEKRRQPSKHYVYRIKVSWSDGKITIIYRRYSQFFALQDFIFNKYPEESGITNPADRIVPLLPGKIIFGRSHIREVAVKRKELINEYLQKLIKLPEHLSRSNLVLEFLAPSSEDVDASSRSVEKPENVVKSADNISDPIVLEQYMVIANFKSDDRNQVSLACGDTVGIIEKHENGWWFVCIEDQQGWVPSSYLEPLNSSREEERGVEVTGVERYICKKEYNAEQHDELSLKLGDIVLLQIKQRDGWWKVKLLSDSAVLKEGLVPAVHLKNCGNTCNKAVQEVKAPPRQNTVKKVKRPRAQKPLPLEGIKEQVSATNGDDGEDEEVIYVSGSDYQEIDSAGTQLDIKEGEELVVLEKTPNGWWKVKTHTQQEGWIPSSLPQRKRRLKSEKEIGVVVSKKKELFTTVSSYDAKEESGLSFKPDQIVELLEKDPSGWWYVKLNEQEGWAPSNYLKRHNNTDTLQNVKIECSISDNKRYENVYVPELTKPDKTGAKPPVAPRPTDLPKSSLIPPKPSPRSRASTDIASAVKMRNKIKQKPDRPASGISQYQIPESNAPLNTDYTNIEVMLNDREKSRGETYVALADYTDTDADILNMKLGQLLLVTKKVDNGWWYAELGDQVGWVPSNYLRKN